MIKLRDGVSGIVPDKRAYDKVGNVHSTPNQANGNITQIILDFSTLLACRATQDGSDNELYKRLGSCKDV